MFKKLRETLTGVKDSETKDASIEVSETKDSDIKISNDKSDAKGQSAGDADSSKSVKTNKASLDPASPEGGSRRG